MNNLPETCDFEPKTAPEAHLQQEVARLQYELTAARDEAERLRARVSEIEDFCADKIGRLPLPDDRTRFADGRYTAFREVYEEAQRVRQQSQSIENGE